jgi:Uma2 family endonuclease
MDPENRSAEVHRRDEAGGLVFEKSLRQGEVPTCGFLPGFSVPVDSFFT